MKGRNKKQKHRHGLRNTIFILLFLSATLPVAIFGTWIINKNSERIEQVMHDDLTMLSENQIQSLQSFLESRKENMDIIAQLSVVKEALWASLSSRHLDARYLDNILQEQVASKEYLRSISVVDRNYVIVSSTDMTIREVYSELSNEDAEFKGGDFFISDIRNDDNEENSSYVEAIRGVFSGNKLLGYIVEKLDVNYIKGMRTQALVGEHGTVILLDGNNAIISSGKALSAESDYDENAYDEQLQEHWNSIDKSSMQAGEFEYTRDSHRIVYYSGINNTEWNILIVMDAGYYTSQANDFKILIVIIMLSILAAMIIIEFYLTRTITGPIHKIVNTLSKVQEKNDYSVRVNYNGRNELGYVAGQIDSMLTVMQADHDNGEKIRQNLEELADSDALTGINNKRAFETALDSALIDINNNKSRIAVGFVDIDDFRDFNTRYGHRIGDQVIRFVALSLEKIIDGEVGRIGGDEFAFFITNEEVINNIKSVLNEYLDIMQVGIGIRGKGTRAVVSCSIGVHITDGGNLERAAIIEKADHAMYIAKESGKNTYHIDE